MPARRPASLRPVRVVPVLRAVVLVAMAGLGSAAVEPAVGETVRDERFYGTAEALFWQRNNATDARPIAVAAGGATDETVLSSRGLLTPIGVGTRVLFGDYGREGMGWEVGYLGLYDMQTRDIVVGERPTIQAAGPLGYAAAGFNNGIGAGADYDSEINSIEANAVFHRFDGGFDRSSRYPWQRCSGYEGGSLDWLAGFRWAGLEETARLGVQPEDASVPSLYIVDATSNLFAGQTGVRGRMAFENWALEGWMKVGVAGTMLSQSQSMTTDYRSPRSSDLAGMGMIADMNLSAIWRFTDSLGLRVGYNVFWLTGVALAPDQWDFSAATGAGAGTGIRGTGSVFLNGVNVGLEGRW